MQAAANYSLSSWTDDTEEAESSGGDTRTAFYMTLYASLAASSLVFQASGVSSGLFSKGAGGDLGRRRRGSLVSGTCGVCESQGPTAVVTRMGGMRAARLPGLLGF